MDNEKIGKFIAELRKEKGMTQKELAEKVGVSDKTISKWECGNSIPDITYLEALCNSLDISVNELLSGERLTDESYSEKAEENIMALMKENETNKKEKFGQIVLGIVLCLLGLVYLAVSSWGVSGMAMWLFFWDVPTVLIYVTLCGGCVLLAGPKTKLEKLSFLQKVVIPVGVFIALASFVLVLARLDDVNALGPSIAVCVLALVYSVVVYLVVTILKVRCEKEILD